jgi:Thin aggregative fimbriae synthesis protein
MRHLAIILFFLAFSALAGDYDVSLGSEVRDGTLKVAPVITAPAGKKLRYDVVTKRTGPSGNHNSKQSANVTVGPDGKAPLSQVAVSVTDKDRYEVKVEVYDGAQLVAAQTLSHPK